MSFQNMKFKINSKEEAANVQVALFAAGYTWSSSGREIKHLEKPMYFTDKYGDISFSDSDEEYFNSHPATEMDLKSVHTFTPYIKPETIVLDGEEYVLEDIKNIIREYAIPVFKR